MPDGMEQGLNLNRLANRHVRQGRVQTVHSSRGATADRVLAHLESFRHPVDACGLYVAVSRARDQVHLYIDDRARLTAAIGLRDGSQAAALDHELDQDAAIEIG